MSALSNIQKSYLARLARRAWRRRADEAVERGEVYFKTEEEFRHQHVAKACGKMGLRCCSQLDYKLVEAHFLDALGEHARAFGAAVRGVTEERRQAEAVLVSECEKAGVRLAYAEVICQRQFKCALADAGVRQVWCLVFTVRNRAASRRRSHCEAVA